MEKILLVVIALVVFTVLNFLCRKSLKVYVIKKFGKNWLKPWGNKVYYWQSSIFVSTAGTFLVMYLLKWLNVVTF